MTKASKYSQVLMVTVHHESTSLKHEVEKSDESPRPKRSHKLKGHGKGSKERME